MKPKLEPLRFVLPLLVVLFSSRAGAQPSVQWQAVFGGTNYDQIDSLLQTDDGGYLLGGYSRSGATGNKTNENFGFGFADYWIIKVDGSGNKQWEKGFGGSSNDFFHAVQPAGDGGFLLAGSSYSPVSGNKTNGNFGLADHWLVKVDASGNKQWEKVFGGSGYDFVETMQPAGDGGFVVGGETTSGISGNKTNANFGGYDFWLVKVDTNGVKVWEKEFGGTANEFLYTILPTSDGGYLLGGQSNSGISGNKTNAGFNLYDFWLVKVDSRGNKQWDRAYGGTNDDWLESIQPTADGGYLLGGSSRSGVSGNRTNASLGFADYWIVKVDLNGNKQWDKAFGGTSSDYLDSITPTSDGGYLLGGFSYSDASGNKSGTNYGTQDYGTEDIWLVKIDANGNKLWDQVYGGSDYDDLYTMRGTSDGGQILGGTSQSLVSGNKTLGNFGDGDCWVIKLGPEPTAIPQLTIVRSGTNAILSWPLASTGFGLEQNGNLSTTNWSGVSQSPADNGTNQNVTLPLSSTNTFFRLKKT